MQCLGIVVYSDGSQSAVFECCEKGSYFMPLAQPRRLTLAPYGLPMKLDGEK